MALAGVRVLDLSRVLAGPYCTMILGDLGADIIKIEQPGIGDGTRQWAPPYAGGEAAYYLSVNRNKRSLTVNLKQPEGRAIIERIAAESDVLIENFKLGEMDKLGLGYDALHASNPRLIYASLTGYGAVGPYKDHPGYDFVVQAQSGIMSLTGPESEPATKVGVAVVDITTGLYAAIAILAALHARDVSGEGQKLDLSLYGSALAWLANAGQSYLVTGEQPPRLGNAHPTVAPYQVFPTADIPIAIGIGNDKQFAAFARIAGQPELAADPRFATNPERLGNRAALIEAMNAILITRPAAYWLDTLVEAGIPAGAINILERVFADPQTQAMGIVQHVAHPTAGQLPLVASPIGMSATPPSIRRHPPLLGEQTDELLAEFGYSAADITRLHETGAV